MILLYTGDMNLSRVITVGMNEVHRNCSLLREQEKRSYRVSLCNRKEVKAMWQCGSVAQISIAHNSDTPTQSDLC